LKKPLFGAAFLRLYDRALSAKRSVWHEKKPWLGSIPAQGFFLGALLALLLIS
jgi:hypothetical protein